MEIYELISLGSFSSSLILCFLDLYSDHWLLSVTKRLKAELKTYERQVVGILKKDGNRVGTSLYDFMQITGKPPGLLFLHVQKGNSELGMFQSLFKMVIKVITDGIPYKNEVIDMKLKITWYG